MTLAQILLKGNGNGRSVCLAYPSPGETPLPILTGGEGEVLMRKGISKICWKKVSEAESARS